VGPEPTDVELEVIAQTWSEHCKHRIFGARIEHERDGSSEVVDGLFRTYVRKISEDIMAAKPGFRPIGVSRQCRVHHPGRESGRLSQGGDAQPSFRD